MTKYTINKVLEKKFRYPVWRIEVDYANNTLAVECRDPKNTQPYFTVYSFDGDILIEDYQVEEKEWTIAAIQGDFLILKKYGTSSPIQSGIQIIQLSTKKIIANFSEYVLKEVFNNTIQAIHRSIPSGLLFYINVENGAVQNNITDLQKTNAIIESPTIFKDKLPHFLKDLDYIDNIWIQKHDDIFIWTFHKKEGDKIALKTILSSKNEILNEKTIIKQLDRLILHPYFKVKDKIFFLSNTKQEIETYLVYL